ncbi:hypothetical protein CYY_008497 [Polysphondylium violaceum]|uniref:MACPF domain-containing protein n=1 Tax=Polysphondylium violaceum TaxID=133409 RepID=A0A8J4PLK9_9MYCE|nr:hypothetical protein CYY_008497 [Polysphondylium violaceum]
MGTTAAVVASPLALVPNDIDMLYLDPDTLEWNCAYFSTSHSPINTIKTKESIFENKYPYGVISKNNLKFFYGDYCTYGENLYFLSDDGTSWVTKPIEFRGPIAVDTTPPQLVHSDFIIVNSKIFYIRIQVSDISGSGIYRFECDTYENNFFYAYDTLASGDFQNGLFDLVFHINEINHIRSTGLVIYLYDYTGNRSPPYIVSPNNLFDNDTFPSPTLTIYQTDQGIDPQTFTGEYHQGLRQYSIEFEIPSTIKDGILEYTIGIFPYHFTSSELINALGSKASISINSNNVPAPVLTSIEFLFTNNDVGVFYNYHPIESYFNLRIMSQNGFKNGIVYFTTEFDQEPIKVEFSVANLIMDHMGGPSDQYNGLFQSFFIISEVCLEQNYRISKIDLYDKNEQYSTWPPVDGVENAAATGFIPSNPSLRFECFNPPLSDNDPPTISSFDSILASDASSIQVTFTVDESWGGYGISKMHNPYIYLTSIYSEFRQQASIDTMDSLFTKSYKTTIPIPSEMIAFGFKLSIYGLTDGKLNKNGYRSIDLVEYLNIDQSKVFYKSSLLVRPTITSLSSYNGYINGHLTIYGKAFPQDSKVYVKMDQDFQYIESVVELSTLIIVNLPPFSGEISVRVEYSQNQVTRTTNTMTTAPVKISTNYVYVDTSSMCTEGCGTHDKPFGNIQDAIDKTDGLKYTIALLPGIYKGLKNNDLNIKDSIVKITSLFGPDSTIIDCEGFGYGFNVDNSKRFSLSEVTIKNCTSDKGAGLFLRNSRTLLNNVHFIKNIATNGGAIYVFGKELIINDCVFLNNTGTYDGAAIFSVASLVKIKGDLTHFIHKNNIDASSNVDIIGQARDILCKNSTIKIDQTISMDGVDFKCESGCNSFYSTNLCIYTPVEYLASPTTPLCTTHSCLTRPNECSCYFNGLLLETFKDNCHYNSFESCFVETKQIIQNAYLDNLMSGVSNVVSRISGYISIYESRYVLFLFSGTNFGFSFKVNGLQVFSLSQSTRFNESTSIYLIDQHIHFIEIIIFSSSISEKQFSMNPILGVDDELFFSNLICGDKVLNHVPNSNPKNGCDTIKAEDCPPDSGAIKMKLSTNNLMSIMKPVVCEQETLVEKFDRCGDGVCNEDPNSCFQDCYKQYTKTCPARSVPDGHIAPGFFIEQDTLGDLISNQFLWKLPGSDHLTFGIDIIDASEAFSPVFQFDYCGDVAQNIIEDAYRGNVYHIPDQLNVKPMPECTFSAKTTSYKSTLEIQREMAENSARDYKLQLEADSSKSKDPPPEDEAFSLSLGISHSNEKSVEESSKQSTTEKERIFKSDVYCKTSFVELDLDRISFNPNFLNDLNQVKGLEDMLILIQRYGTYFYKSSFLGGKLSQLTITRETNVENSSENSWEEKSQTSMSLSVKTPMFSIDGGGIEESLDKKNKESTEDSETTESTTSKVLTYGGIAAAFSPASDGYSSPTYDQWVESIDLLPVPIDYQLFPIKKYINPSWVNKYNQKLSELWTSAEKVYYILNGFYREVDTPYSIIFRLDKNVMPNNVLVPGNPLLQITYWPTLDKAVTVKVPLPHIHIDTLGKKHSLLYISDLDEFQDYHCRDYQAFNRDISSQFSYTATSCDKGSDDITSDPIRYDIDLPIDLFSSKLEPQVSLSFKYNNQELILNSPNQPSKIINWDSGNAILFSSNQLVKTTTTFATVAFENRWAWHLSPTYFKDRKMEFSKASFNCEGSSCLDTLSFQLKYEGFGIGDDISSKVFSTFNLKQKNQYIHWQDFTFRSADWESFDLTHQSKIGMQTRVLWMKAYTLDETVSWHYNIKSYHIKTDQKTIPAEEFVEVNNDGLSYDRFNSTRNYKFSKSLEYKQLFTYHNYNYPTQGVKAETIYDIFTVKRYGTVLTNGLNSPFVSMTEKFYYNNPEGDLDPIQDIPVEEQASPSASASASGEMWDGGEENDGPQLSVQGNGFWKPY